MRFFTSAAVVALAAQSVVADGWFGKAGRTAYDKWHQTELERWLSDHDIPYPAASDRKDLQDLVSKNWENNVVKPYNSWDTHQLQNYLSSKGQEVKKGTEKNKDSLVQQVEGLWHETADKANDAYGNVQDWIFDTWTESQLKAFLDYHNIPNPSPRTRDSLLHTARANYQKAADKAGETAAYPGNWLYQSWSDSDLKAWLDERGVPVPQPSTRDKLVASLRRNSRLAANRAAQEYASASKSAAAAQQSLSDQLLESWSDSQIKEWFDSNGIKVPQGSKRNELIALARKHSAQLTGNNAKNSAASAYGAATSSAGNYYAQGTQEAYGAFRYYYDVIANQFGFASAEAQKSLSSASAEASKTASSLSSKASVDASKSSNVASKSASSAAKDASKSAASASKDASKSAESAANKAGKAYDSATDAAKKEL
ncbi:Stress response protein ish1 [Pseudocercospora fuligena]|uniref:Stress response protein ish1 n=1 Tax=Pseudocercospora fuligena TaxID=685502 RepID=A0A8H6VLB7_9PEZI|nr:Stress response protein ish1 [Pseudocercospora fuligena]